MLPWNDRHPLLTILFIFLGAIFLAVVYINIISILVDWTDNPAKTLFQSISDQLAFFKSLLSRIY